MCIYLLDQDFSPECKRKCLFVLKRASSLGILCTYKQKYNKFMTKSIGYTLQIRNRAKAALKEKKCLVIALAIIAIMAVMEVVEYAHYMQFVERSDGFWVHWNWIFFVPVAILWIWAEAKRKYTMQFFAGGVFCLTDVALLGGVMIREHYFFSSVEGAVLLGGEIVCIGLFFFLYVPAKFFERCEDPIKNE